MRTLLLSIIASTFGGLSYAAVVNIDFNTASSATYSGLAAAPDSAGATALWNPILNNLGTASGTGLKDSTGVVTAVGFSVSVNGTISNANTNAERSGGYLSLMRDYVRLDSGGAGIVGTRTGSFSGLTVARSYDVYFYGQGENFGFGASRLRGQNSLFTINGVNKQTSWDGVVGGNGVLSENVEYVKFTAVADSNGKINFSWSNVISAINGPDADGITPGSQFAALNAIQLVESLVPVPEPSSALLGSLGVLGLFLRRRR